MELECINRVELRGIVGTSRVTEVGDRNLINFSLATNYAYKDKDGYPVIDLARLHGLADREEDLSLYRKGTPLHVEGRIRNLRYTDTSGCERTSWEVIASKVGRADQ